MPLAYKVVCSWKSIGEKVWTRYDTVEVGMSFDPKLADEICARRRFFPMSAKYLGSRSTFDV